MITSARTGTSIDVSNVVHGCALRAQKPRRTMQFQGSLVAIVLDVLTAVERVRYELLQHLRRELNVTDAEGEVGLGYRAHVHLGWQVVLDYRFRGILDRLELALYQGRRKPTVAVDIDSVNIVFGVA